MFKFKLPILVIVTVLFFSNFAIAGIFIQGGFGANTYINKEANHSEPSYSATMGYSNNYFDIGGIIGYSSIFNDHNITIEELDVFSVGFLLNYKPFTIGNITPFVGIGLNYNIFNGEQVRFASDEDLSQDYLSKNNCTLEKDKNNNTYYRCYNDFKFNSITTNLRAGLQYHLTEAFSILASVSYDIRLNNNKNTYKNYNIINYNLAIRFNF